MTIETRLMNIKQKLIELQNSNETIEEKLIDEIIDEIKFMCNDYKIELHFIPIDPVLRINGKSSKILNPHRYDFNIEVHMLNKKEFTKQDGVDCIQILINELAKIFRFNKLQETSDFNEELFLGPEYNAADKIFDEEAILKYKAGDPHLVDLYNSTLGVFPEKYREIIK
jgi:hypothetical protein